MTAEDERDLLRDALAALTTLARAPVAPVGTEIGTRAIIIRATAAEWLAVVSLLGRAVAWQLQDAGSPDAPEAVIDSAWQWTPAAATEGECDGNERLSADRRGAAPGESDRQRSDP